MGFFGELMSAVGLAVTSVLNVTAPAPPEPPIRGVWPLRPPVIVHRFEPATQAWGAGHRGVDLGGRPGNVVLASLGGTVTFAGLLAGRGVIVISHGETRTTYEPVTAEVHVAEVVESGEPIGTLELAQSHCLPDACLHWGWLRGDDYLDPLRLVDGTTRTRLLPLRLEDAPADTRS